MVDSVREENRAATRMGSDPAIVEPRHEALRTGLPAQGFVHEEAQRTGFGQENQEAQRSAQRVTRGFAADAIAGIGTMVLAIVALAKVYPEYLGPIACIVAGAALILKSASVASRFTPLWRETGGTTGSEIELGGGMTTELVAGVGAIVLGILALIGFHPVTLSACAVIALGAALLLGGGETYRVSQLPSFGMWHQEAARSAHLATESAAGLESLAGIAAIVLGIVALCVSANPGVVMLVGLLVIGSAELLAGGAVSGYLGMLTRGKRMAR